MQIRLFLGALLAAIFPPAGAIAATSGISPAQSRRLDQPTPVMIVHPTALPARFKDATVKLTFVIDEQGSLHHVASVGRMPEDLASRLLPAVAQWKFTPRYENGRPVRVRVILPLTLAEEA